MHANAAPRSTLARLQGLFVLLRPRQWVKNVFVLAPLLFTGQFIHATAIVDSLFAMAIFCLASSACYIVNDLHDIERDRRHPKKSLSRPLASGVVPIPLALAALALLYLLLAFSWWSFPKVLPVIAGYLLINLAYTFVLKHQPVIDIFTVATGFVLRVYAGAMALNVPVSAWMFVTTLCLALYLAAVKRRQELANHGGGSREVLGHYTPALIDRYAEMAATGALLFYSLFVMQTRPELVLTIPLVLFGLYRYWFIVEARDEGESPTDALLGDWQLQVTVLIWCAACAHALWPN